LQKPKLSQAVYGQFLPMMNYRRSTKCADGSCAVFTKTDPSVLFGKPVADQAKSKGIKSISLYETEGVQPCAIKPDLALNTENFLKTVRNTNIVFALST